MKKELANSKKIGYKHKFEPPKPTDYIFSNSKTSLTLRNIQHYMLYIYESCPICKKVQSILYRYNDRVCNPCLEKYYIMDSSNNRLLVGNLGIAGGLQVFQVNTDISGNMTKVELPYTRTVPCFINGRPVVAQECMYGGIMVTSLE